MGIRAKNLRFAPQPPDKLAHYASAADVHTISIGWQEVEWIHNRSTSI